LPELLFGLVLSVSSPRPASGQIVFRAAAFVNANDLEVARMGGIFEVEAGYAGGEFGFEFFGTDLAVQEDGGHGDSLAG
jgi:hypothetical protein